MSAELSEKEETAIENQLQQLSDVAVKAGLVFDDTVEQKVCNPDVVLLGTRMQMQHVKGATLLLPCHPYLTQSSSRQIYVTFPDTASLVGAKESDMIDVQVSYRKDVVAMGSNQTGLRIVSGAVGVSLSSADAHMITPSKIDFGMETVEITLPVNTSALSDEETDTFFDGHKVQCVYWKDTSKKTTLLDFGRWSNLGCKATSFSRQLDERGEPIRTLGFVTCQCNHLTHFAVGFGETKVRFKQDPTTPRPRDMFQVQSGDMVAFHVDIENDFVVTAQCIDLPGFIDSEGAGCDTWTANPSWCVGSPDDGVYDPPSVYENGDGIDPSEACCVCKPEEVTRGITVDVVSITPAGRSFPQGDPTMIAKSSNAYRFEWMPRDAGTYRIEIDLKFGEDLVDTRIHYVRVLFCEHFLQSGETLQDVAIIYDMPWQTLFAINSDIQNPRVLNAEANGRLWICSNGNCVLEAASAGTVVKIGRLYTVQQQQTLVDVVNVTRSSFSQLQRHNLKRLHMEGTQVYDVMHRHNSTGFEISYAGEEFCVVSKLADESCLI